MTAFLFSLALALQGDDPRIDQLIRDLTDKSTRKRDAAQKELEQNAAAWWKIYEAKAPELADERSKKLLTDLAAKAKKRDPELMKPAAVELLQSDVLGQQLRFAGVFEDRLRLHLKEQGFDVDDAALLILLLHVAPQLTNDDVKASVAHSLGRLATPDRMTATVDLLRGWMKEDFSLLRAASVDSLADLRATGAADEILALARDPVPLVRSRAVRAMAAVGSKAHVPKLEQLLSDPDPRLRDGVLESLFILDPEHSVRIARGALSDSDPMIRHRCLKFLMARRVREAHADVAKLFSDPEPTVRADAVRFMTRVCVTEHMDAMCALKTDPSPAVRIRLLQAIRLLDQRDRAQTVSDLIKFNTTSEVRFEIARTIGALQLKEFAKQLPPLMRDQAARYAAANALARLNAAEFVSEVVRLAKNQDQDVAYHGIDALADWGVPEGSAVMIDNLKPDRGRALVSSIVGLGMLGDKSALDKVIAAGGNRTELRAAIAFYLIAVDAKDKKDLVQRVVQDRNDQLPRRLASQLSFLRHRDSWLDMKRKEFDPGASTLGELLSELERQTGIKVTMSSGQDMLRAPVSVNFPLTVLEAIQYVMAGTQGAILIEKDGLVFVNLSQARTYLAEWLKEWK